ncbi:MAG: hypothetical protein LAN62_00530 [Acidobacteriia bacterium]|nr:hypothetical protein [Terriglobia bacterium]
MVRVQAGEVRRRLEQYYHQQTDSSPVRIGLPVGSYVPEFHHYPTAPSIGPKTSRIGVYRSMVGLVTVAVVGLGVLLALLLPRTRGPSARPPESALDQFWSPVFATSQPILICLAKPVVYRPSLNLYRRFSKSHPATFQSEVERNNRPLPLDPKEMVPWGDLVQYPEFGVAMGDVYVAARLSTLFARINKPSQVRIGNDYSFEDLRNSPAVLVGAFNNRWTLQMTSNLRFVFAEEDGRFRIEDRSSPGRVWSVRLGPQGEVMEDYGVVTRLLDSKTGQVLIAAAGIYANGTRAAGEFISSKDYLAECLRAAPPDWHKKDLQVLVQTTVTDAVAGPPRVVATYFW